MKLSLELILRPVKVKSVSDRGFEKEHLVKPGFFCSESIPVGSEPSWYKICIFTDVSRSSDVYQLHNQLVIILDEIAEAWPVVTGYRLGSLDRKQTNTLAYISNMDEVISKLQKEEGLISVTSSLPLGWEVYNCYEKPPIEDVLILRDECIKNPELKKLIGYYHQAVENKEFWFVSLYKIKDQLNSIHNKKAKLNLNIDNVHWSFFEDKLNNHDLRHPGNAARKEPIDDKDKNKLFLISRGWIAKELEFRSLPFRKRDLEDLSNEIGRHYDQ